MLWYQRLQKIQLNKIKNAKKLKSHFLVHLGHYLHILERKTLLVGGIIYVSFK